MDRKRGLLPLVLPALFLAGAISCGPQTELDTGWDISPASGVTYRKLVILSVFRDPDNGRNFERNFCHEFERRDIEAIPGYSLLRREADLPREELENRVNATGADGVLVVKMLAVDRMDMYVRPTRFASTGTRYPDWWSDPYWGYYHPYPYHYWGNWRVSSQVIWTPGYWETNFAFRIETSLYRASDNRLVWTATSSTYYPQEGRELGTSLGRAILAALKDDGFIAPN